MKIEMSVLNHFVCNKCYLPKSSDPRCFYLTQCGHIFCPQCAETGGSTCQRCQTPNVQILELNDSSSSVSYLFTPLPEFLENMTRTLNFQSGQMTSVDKLLREQEEKNNSLKRAYWENKKTLLLLQQKKEKIKNSIRESLEGKQNYPQQVTNSGTANRRFSSHQNFFRQETAQNNFSRASQDQRPGYPFGRKVAFVNPNNPYDSDNPNSTCTPTINMNTPGNMGPPQTPETVLRRVNYRRERGSSAAPSSSASSIDRGTYLSNKFI